MSGQFHQYVDAATVALARNGDRRAQADLYGRFGAAVYTLARRLLARPELAEDVLQDTFVDMMRGLPAFRSEAPVGLWIRQIAVNQCLMHMRSHWQRCRMTLERAADEIPADAWRCDDSRDWQNALDLERALEALPAEARAVVWLHDVEGYTHREIARFMHATPNFSKSQLARAHARLRCWAIEEAGEETCMPVLGN